jgi:hypothetical protein
MQGRTPFALFLQRHPGQKNERRGVRKHASATVDKIMATEKKRLAACSQAFLYCGTGQRPTGTAGHNVRKCGHSGRLYPKLATVYFCTISFLRMVVDIPAVRGK